MVRVFLVILDQGPLHLILGGVKLRLVEGLRTEQIDLRIGEDFVTLLPVIRPHRFIVVEGRLVGVEGHLTLPERLTVLDIGFLDEDRR